jgi:hypothetical protein
MVIRIIGSIQFNLNLDETFFSLFIFRLGEALEGTFGIRGLWIMRCICIGFADTRALPSSTLVP